MRCASVYVCSLYNNVVCLFSASFDHRKILSALLTIFSLLPFHVCVCVHVYASVRVGERREERGRGRKKELKTEIKRLLHCSNV